MAVDKYMIGADGLEIKKTAVPQGEIITTTELFDWLTHGDWERIGDHLHWDGEFEPGIGEYLGEYQMVHSFWHHVLAIKYADRTSRAYLPVRDELMQELLTDYSQSEGFDSETDDDEESNPKFEQRPSIKEILMAADKQAISSATHTRFSMYGYDDGEDDDEVWAPPKQYSNWTPKPKKKKLTPADYTSGAHRLFHEQDQM